MTEELIKQKQELLHKQMFDTTGRVIPNHLNEMESLFQMLIKQSPTESKHQYNYADYMYQINKHKWFFQDNSQTFAPKRNYEEMTTKELNKNFRDDFVANEAKDKKQYKSAMRAYLYRVQYQKERLGKGLNCSAIKNENQCISFDTQCRYNKILSKCENLTLVEKNIRKANFASNAKGIFDVYTSNVEIDIIHPDGVRQIDALSKKLIYLFKRSDEVGLSEADRNVFLAQIDQTRTELNQVMGREVQYVTHTNKWKFVASTLSLIAGYIAFAENNQAIIEYFLRHDAPYFMVIFADYIGLDIKSFTVDEMKTYCEWVVFFIGANLWVTDYAFSEKKLKTSVMESLGTSYTNSAKKRHGGSKITESFMVINIQSIMENIRLKMDGEGTVAKIIRLGSPLKFFADFSMSKSGDAIRLFNGLHNVYVDYIELTIMSYLTFINNNFGLSLTEDKVYAFYIHFFMMTCIVLIQSFGNILSKPLLDLINEISRKTGFPLPEIKTVKQTIASSKYSGVLYRFAVKIFQVIHRIITVKSMGLLVKTFVKDNGILEAMDINSEMEYYATLLFYTISFVAVLRDRDLASQILDMLCYIPRKILSIPYIKVMLEQIRTTLAKMTASMGGFAEEDEMLEDEIRAVDKFMDEEEYEEEIDPIDRDEFDRGEYNKVIYERHQYDRRVDHRLDVLGKESVECGSRGDCFFRCMLVALGLENTDENSLTLRLSVMALIRTNKSEYEHFIALGEDWNTFEEYVTEMSKASTYIEGDLEILATARLLGVNIKVYKDSEDADGLLLFTPLQPSDRTIEIANYGPNIHYKLVQEKTEVPEVVSSRSDAFVSAETPIDEVKDELKCPKDYVFVPAKNTCVKTKPPPKPSKRRRT